MTFSDMPDGNHDPLWRSLERILTFFHLRLDRHLAESQIAVDWAKPLTPADILMIARHMRMDATVHAMAGVDIAGLRKPALILLPHTQSLVALPQQDNLPALWVPEGNIDLDALCVSTDKNLYVIEFDRATEAASREDASDTRTQWFWGLLRAHGREYFDIGLATFFINLFVLITPLFSMTVFDRVVPNHAHETLFALSIGIILAYLFNLGFKLVRGHVLGTVIAKVATRLDTDFMDQLLRLTVPAHKMTVGERFDLFHELQNLRDFFAAGLIPALVDLPFFILFLLVITLISWEVGIVVVIGVILLLVVNVVCRRAVSRAAKSHFREARGKNATLVELLTGGQAIRMFNATGSALFKWHRVADRVATSARHSQHVSGLAGDLSLTVMSLISIFVIIVGVDAIERNTLSVGGLVACNILVSRTLSPVMVLASMIGRLRQSLDSLKTIDNIFHMPAEPKVTPDYEPKGPFSGAMRLQDVTFYHPGQVHPTLYRLSLDIRPGDRVGIIGRTGAGKSTITRMLDGSLTPQSGNVFADEMSLNLIHPADWRQSLGIVPQEPFMFSGTLRENIMLGVNDGVDEDWLKHTLTLSGLEFLMKQSGHSLDYDVGEAGMRLSGGQRQAVALARALIRRPNILLLDEPTNGMDHELELRVKAALHAYTKDKTLVMVTHRTSLLDLATRLVLIDHGGVAADGPPNEVMRRLSGGKQA